MIQLIEDYICKREQVQAAYVVFLFERCPIPRDSKAVEVRMKYFPKASKSWCVSHVQKSSLTFFYFSCFLIWSLLFLICFLNSPEVMPLLPLLHLSPIGVLFPYPLKCQEALNDFPESWEESDFDHCFQCIISCSSVPCSQVKYRHLQSGPWEEEVD